MSALSQRSDSPALPPMPPSDAVHDLRNLFGVVEASVNLLREMAQSDRAAMLLDAIDQAAIRGDTLARCLLSGTEPAGGVRCTDLNSRIAELETTLRSLVGPRLRLELDLCLAPLSALIDPDGFDHVLIELATNARRAIDRSGTVHIRSRRCGDRAWVMIADDGPGTMPRSLSRPASRGATGIHRVRHWVDEAAGRLHIRSYPGVGTTVAISLPLVSGRPHPIGRLPI